MARVNYNNLESSWLGLGLAAAAAGANVSLVCIVTIVVVAKRENSLQNQRERIRWPQANLAYSSLGPAEEPPLCCSNVGL